MSENGDHESGRRSAEGGRPFLKRGFIPRPPNFRPHRRGFRPDRFDKIPILWPVLWLILSLAGRGSLSQTLPIAPNLIEFTSAEGERLLSESRYKKDYFPLSIQFVTQDNPSYCGVASIVMVLNSLGIPAPDAPKSNRYHDYHYLTQSNFFENPKTRSIITPEEVSRQGMTLEQMGKLLEAYSVSVRLYHGGDISLEEFRRSVADNLQTPGNFVLINYLRRSIAQEWGGHISPIAAYDRESDRFLILDVARYKYPPVWVKAEELWKAIRTVDPVSGKTRGFALVSK